MKKRYAGLALAVFLLAGSALTAHAEDIKVQNGWKAEFTGDKIESNFTSGDLAREVIKDLQPGDSVEIYVAVKNSSGKGTDWYMSNEVLQSLEDSSQAKNGAYTYELLWKGTGDPTILYSSESVGGTKQSSAGQGLHEATDNLEQFFYLDHLSKGEEGVITLRIALNGETQGNDYQKTLARLQLNFAVEGTDNEAGSKRITRTNHNVTYSPGPVQTGDPAQMLLWSTVALIGGLGLLICAVIYQKKRRGGDERE